MRAGCRVSRVRYKAGGAVIEVFPERKHPDDTNFVATLVWVLEQARLGAVVGYAMVFSVDDGESTRCIEAAKPWEAHDKHHVLGLIRRLEQNYIAREWADEE